MPPKTSEKTKKEIINRYKKALSVNDYFQVRPQAEKNGIIEKYKLYTFKRNFYVIRNKK